MKHYLLQKTCSALLLGISFFFLVLAPSQVSAQSVKEEWVKRYAGNVPSQESSVHLTVDDAGNSYVSGNSYSTSLGNHFITVKYSPAGQELWVNRYIAFISASVRGIAIDDKGDVFITGSHTGSGSRANLLVLKYKGTDGSQAWIQNVGPPQVSGGNSIIVDNKGGVYVSGSTASMGPPTSTIFIHKYSTETGEFMWGKSFDPNSVTAEVRRFITYGVDSAGDFYLAGGNATNDLIIKYRGTDGTKLWSYILDDPIYAGRTGLTLHNGNVYLSGNTQLTGTYLVKHSAEDGKQIWLQQNIKSPDDSPFTSLENLVTDNEGGLYGVATVNTAKYVASFSATDGKLLWATRSSADIVALLTDEVGNVYAKSTQGETNHLLTKYNATTGNELWEYGFRAINTNISGGPKIQTDNKRHVYIAGLKTFIGEAIEKIFVARINADSGKELWEAKFTGTTQVLVKAVANATDEAGNIYIIGKRGLFFSRPGVETSTDLIILKYSPDGNLLWEKSYTNVVATSLVLDKNGGVYVLGSIADNIITIKYNAADGDIIWESVLKNNSIFGFGQSLAVDGDGGVYIIGGSIYEFNKIVTVKYDAETGRQQWLTSYDKGELNNSIAIVVTGGFVYVAGTSYRTGQGDDYNEDIILMKYNADNGVQQWQTQYDIGNEDLSVAMEVLPQYGIFLLVHNDEKQVVTKFDPVHGNFLWSVEIADIKDEEEMQMVVDTAGGIYITGGGEDGSIITLKYNQSGALVWASKSGDTEYGTGLSIETDNKDGVYVLGSYAPFISGSRFTTLKYDAESGKQLWAVTRDVGNSEFPVDLALDKDLNVIVTGGGYIGTGYAPGDDILTIKYSQDLRQPGCDIPVYVRLSLPPEAIAVGEQVRSTAYFGNYILGDDHGIRWEWGDGTESSVSYKDAGATHITGQHRYTEAGFYKVGLDFSLSCLQAAYPNYNYDEWMAIYDANAGSVSGEGSFVSPLSGTRFMNFEGPVTYNFSVGYANANDTVPEGSFQVTLGTNGTFHSTSLEWLVIRGNQAVWKGIGEINGESYRFMASVTDAGGSGPDDPGDKMRVIIFDMEPGYFGHYDNSRRGDIRDLSIDNPLIASGNIIINGTPTIATTQQAELYNYPNTFTDKTTINFTLPTSGEYTLEVYDMRGKLVQQLATGKAEANQNYSYELNGAALQKGLYVARLVTASGTQSIKMLLQR